MKHEDAAQAVTALLDAHGLQHTVSPGDGFTSVSTTNANTGLSVEVKFHSNGTVESGPPQMRAETFESVVDERNRLAQELEQVRANLGRAQAQEQPQRRTKRSK